MEKADLISDLRTELKAEISFDVYSLRKEFPILNQQINGYPLIYFDNAATNQKPLSIINSIKNYYENINSNVHRGIHTLSERATEAYVNDVTDSVKIRDLEKILIYLFKL